MKKLLIVWHSMTGGSEALARAACTGGAEVEARRVHAGDVTAADMLGADGYLFVFPENLAAISGVMKAFFDQLYYPCLGQMEGRAFAVIVCAGSDGRNAVAQAERIATGWRLKPAADALIVCTHAQTPEQIQGLKQIGRDDLARCTELGAALAAGLSLGVF